MIQPLVCHRFCRRNQNKQRSGRHENTNAHTFRPPPVNFLLLLPTTLAHLLLSLSAAFQSGRHAPVAPLERLRCVPAVTACHSPNTTSHTHAHTPPQDLVLSTMYRPHNHDTYSLPLLKGLYGESKRVRFLSGLHWFWKKVEICTVPTQSPQPKALTIKMLLASKFI